MIVNMIITITVTIILIVLVTKGVKYFDRLYRIEHLCRDELGRFTRKDNRRIVPKREVRKIEKAEPIKVNTLSGTYYLARD